MKDSIKISPENFRSVVQSKTTLSDLADKLSVSKQTVNSWLSSGSLPAKHFLTMQAQLKFSSRELDEICARQNGGAVLFRTRRNYTVMKRNQEIASGLARDYFDFFWTFQETKPVALISERKSFDVFAKKLRHEISINTATSLTSIIKKLEIYGIHVLFADFEELFNFTDISKKNVPCAFCYQHDSQHSIVINIKEKLDDIPWIIFHELAHIFRGDLTNGSPLIEDEDIEVFCNKVATEAIMPTKWFMDRKELLMVKLASPRPSCVYVVEEICRELNASFKGVALRLNELELISGHVRNYLMGANTRKEKTSLKITDYISTPYDDDRVVFWKNAFRGVETLNCLKLQFATKKALLEEKISLKRASDFYFLKELQMESLYESWREETN